MKSLLLHMLLLADIFALSAGLLAPLPVVALAGLSFTWFMAYWNLLMLP